MKEEGKESRESTKKVKARTARKKSSRNER